ncbi:hypothetical protein [Janthinobacterium sp.]|uniref:hypothetical protein n=1 Tax=Janthinobacterium sp. TaxID=1871054 RepID=UPI00293D8509|nr:hypothetical protein [Janthinobacterium sp.]
MGASARRPPRQGGAVLLILLSVIGLGVATLLIAALGKNRQQEARERKTLQILTQAKEALSGFAASNGRLPRPARSALDGGEQTEVCADDAACSGFLPWITLGVSGVDAWGRLLRYSVTPAFTSAPVSSAFAVATKTVRGRWPDGRLHYLAGQGRCAADAPCLPYVLYSSGRKNFGTSADGTAQANAARGNLDEAVNAAAVNDFIARAPGDDPAQAGGEFDDLLEWMSLPQLYQRMRAGHNLP